MSLPMIRQPTLRALPRLSVAGPRRVQLRIQTRSFFGRRKRPSDRAIEELDLRRLSQEREDYDRHRRVFLLAGAIAGVISSIYLSYRLYTEVQKSKVVKADSTLPPTDPLASGSHRKVIIHDEEGRELVPTGNSTVPTFPRTIDISPFSEEPSTQSPSAADPLAVVVPPSLKQQATEYTLVGLGTRSVSFLGINVYVVGFYIATADIAALQSRLAKQINPIATTLVSGEKDELRRKLLDPEEGEEIWDALLREGVVARSAFRVVPVRDTDFHHLRDGFVRAIQARSDKLLGGGAPTPAGAAQEGPEKDAFKESMRQFRQAFNRGKVPKTKELLLVREGDGQLRIVYSDGSAVRHRQLIGTVPDERVSRALWLNWLAGKKVASEPARESIVNGIMEFVERPVGTVAAQVV